MMIPKIQRGRRLVIATHNAGKLAEFETYFAACGIPIVGAGQLGVPEIDETGITYQENAHLKAAQTASFTGEFALGDDSGLAVDALGGAPGIYSARWAGEPRNFASAMQKVEADLQAKGATEAAQRQASFICVLCLASPAGESQSFEGRVWGTLIWPPRGTRGFGYDPMFVPDGYIQTFGEMDPEKKDAISHRAKAFAAFKAAAID